MPTPATGATGAKRRLSAEVVIEGAVALADEIGIEAFTIRKLAEAIDAKPMTIYHHVPNKEAIIDGMVDHVFAEIELPPSDLGWREAMAVRCHSMRAVLARHRWAPPLMESRSEPGLANLRHHDAVLGCLRRAGFSLELTSHAYATIDAFLYGFALEEANLPETGGEEMGELARGIAEQMPDDFPYLKEFALDYVFASGGAYDYRNQFEFGLNLILDGLEAALAAETD